MKTKRACNMELIKTPDKKEQRMLLKDVVKITPNICIQKGECQNCNRGDKYGIPLHFLLHYLDGGIRTVCFTCGKKAAGETGLKLLPTESDIFAREEKADLRIIRAAQQKMDAKNERIDV